MSTSTAMPQLFSKWKHRTKGTLYKVAVVANEHATKPDYPITVVYTDLDNRTWARPLESFLASMELVEQPNAELMLQIKRSSVNRPGVSDEY